MIRTAILGASGYVGGELLRLCAGHPDLRPARLFGDSKAGQRAAPQAAASCDILEMLACFTSPRVGRWGVSSNASTGLPSKTDISSMIEAEDAA